jgi:hypothetical protein
MCPLADGAVDGLVGTRVHHDVARPVALTDDVQRGLVGGAGEVVDVGGTGFGDPQAVQTEQAHGGVGGAAFVLGGGEQVGELVAVQPWHRAAVPDRPADPGSGVADQEVFVFEPSEPGRQGRDAPVAGGVGRLRDELSEFAQVQLEMRAPDPAVGV